MELVENSLFLLFVVKFFNAVTQVDPLSFPLYIVTMRNLNCSHIIPQTGQTNTLNSRRGHAYWTLFKHPSGISNSTLPTTFTISDLWRYLISSLCFLFRVCCLSQEPRIHHLCLLPLSYLSLSPSNQLPSSL